MVHTLVIVALALCACGNKKAADKQEDKAVATSADKPADPTAAPAAPAAPTGAQPTAGADPWSAPGAGGAGAGGGGGGGGAGVVAAPSNDTDDPDEGGEVAAEPVAVAPPPPPLANDRAGLIAQLCVRDQECGCPVENCEEGFMKLTTITNSAWACIVQQSCETLCAPNSGAPGTALHKACLAGPAGGGGGGARKACRRSSDCGGSFECCSGLCYEMGTSMWITACQMPTGKF
ncbi:MAG: hypothetical protein H0T46_11865 [Deltaproteobacteria bacterium]|nr:hypothetical protein [Deltaproteobacteria bacterium]